MLTAQAERVETGQVQFGDDWPGIFIRGDSAGYYALILRNLLANPEAFDTSKESLIRAQLQSLQRILAKCVIGQAREMVQS